MRVAQWSKLSDRALKAMRRIGRPVTASELTGAGGLSRANGPMVTEALEAVCEAGLVTREERVEPYSCKSRVNVIRVYYALVGGEGDRG